MLAIKLHKGKHPNTRRGSFWIPIVDWSAARTHIRSWSRNLAPVYYITLVRVPDSHPVFVGVDWSIRPAHPRWLPYVSMRDVKQSVLAALKPLPARVTSRAIWIGEQPFLTFGPREAGELLTSYPEMVLGADLPRRCIKWTKDIRLLTRSDTRETQSKRTACV
jgi:hypothetical protein